MANKLFVQHIALFNSLFQSTTKKTKKRAEFQKIGLFEENPLLTGAPFY